MHWKSFLFQVVAVLHVIWLLPVAPLYIALGEWTGYHVARGEYSSDEIEQYPRWYRIVAAIIDVWSVPTSWLMEKLGED